MRQQKTRHNQHITDDDDSVAKFLSRYQVSLPPMKILEENLTIEDGARKEGDYVKQSVSPYNTLLSGQEPIFFYH